MNRIRSKLTYANVISTLCLVLVLGGGTAYAASQLEKESVGTKQLAKEAVNLAKIKKGAKEKLQGQTGPAGAKGATGAQGIPGPAGANGATKIKLIQANGTGTASAQCHPGEHITGGGALDNGAGVLAKSYPNTALGAEEPSNGWTAESSNGADSITVRILCASP